MSIRALRDNVGRFKQNVNRGQPIGELILVSFDRTQQFRCRIVIFFAVLLICVVHVDELAADRAAFESQVQPFFDSHCIRCHGSNKQKGDTTLHTLGGDFSTGRESQQWESILEMLESGEMPPEDEPQPNDADRTAVVRWIEAGLRQAVETAQGVPFATRRLTNFEYQNTIRDLVGFELKLIESLAKDPVKPYRFNNTADLMQIGPEQFDRYRECARRVMASAIVDPEPPKIHKSRREWKPHGLDRGLGADEISPWGNRRNTPSWGMGLRSFPKTGEYRIRVKASAIFPPGISEIPLRLVMGYGININSATQQIEPVGTVRLRNSPDDPQVFELYGRIENHPAQPGRAVKGEIRPDKMTITPQNLYDDGTLNDGRRDLTMPRAVVEWIEFEAPLSEVWPPEHHSRILFESPLRESDPPAYVRAVLQRFMSRAYRRPANVQEVDRFVKIYDIVRRELGTLEAAMRETLAMVLVSPQFMYHTMVDEFTSDQYALASRLSYFLWGSMPDDELLRIASENKLDDSVVIEQQVRRMLKDSRSREFIHHFTWQWLSLSKSKTVPINRDLFPRFLYYVSAGERAGTEVPYRPTIRDHMINETVSYVAELVRRNANILDIVDSDFAMLNQPLAAHYGVEGVEGDALRPVALKGEHHLGGLLTHGSILIGNGTGTAPHPIYRAVWLREAILGDDVSPPPADVPALSDSAGESAEKAMTIKGLLEKHRQKESCNECHVRLDPWGIPFERYNAIGKFQPRVAKDGTRVSRFNRDTHKNLSGYQSYLRSINTIDVEADATVPRGPHVDGLAELKSHLIEHRGDEIAENVLRRLMTYGMGRKLTFHDRFAISELLGQAKDNGYRFQDMIVSICQSKTFRATTATKKPLSIQDERTEAKR